MKRKRDLLSIFIEFLIILIIITIVLESLDILGFISLPEKLSLKTYFPNTILTAGLGNNEIYYPDYDATGTTADNDSTEETNIAMTNASTTDSDLSEFINSANKSQNNRKNSEYNVTDNSYFYNQLDSYGKTIYSKVYSSLDDLKTGLGTIDFGTTFNDLLQTEQGNQKLTDSFQLSINALLLDHPEIFYLDVTKIYMFTQTTTSIRGTTYRISIGPNGSESYLSEGFYSKSNVLMAETQVESISENIINSLSGNTYTKLKSVHDYLVDNITYDKSNTSASHNLYGALVNKSAVCDGYAKAYKYILDKIGISCVEVCGIGQNSNGETENHAWNDVLIDGTWYAVDVTWDDPIIVGGRGVLTDDLRYSNFLKGSNVFYRTHQEDGYIVSNGEFKYPTISSYDYN